MQRIFGMLTAICLTFTLMAILPAQADAACHNGWKFVNDGPCAIKITVNTDGPCIGNQISFTIPANSSLSVGEVCCITAVKVELGGPCFTPEPFLPVRCIAGQQCDLPSPFNSVGVRECVVRIN